MNNLPRRAATANYFAVAIILAGLILAAPASGQWSWGNWQPNQNSGWSWGNWQPNYYWPGTSQYSEYTGFYLQRPLFYPQGNVYQFYDYSGYGYYPVYSQWT